MPRPIGLAVVTALAVTLFVPSAFAKKRDDQPAPIARGAHVSGSARFQPNRPPGGGGGGSQPATCSAPDATNKKVNCHGTGRPVNETWIAAAPSGTTLYAGANDYNSYNGQGQDGFYWSTDSGATWNDAGPLDVFAHNTNNGAGDPGLAVDANGVIYYSSLFFNFNRCGVGGVELLRRAASSTSWSTYQIAANSSTSFQDKPAIAVGGSNVYVSWTQFGSCSGVGVTSPIKVAVFATGASSSAPASVLTVPGSTYSQGSSIAPDGAGGFWVTWEEYPSSSATVGSIRVAHYNGTTWGSPQTISPSGFADLPSPLPGFSFRNDSFPALTVVAGVPKVVWTSYDSGVGRAYLWNGSSVAAVTPNDTSTLDHQFFPAIAPDGAGGVYVSFSQANPTYTDHQGRAIAYDQVLADVTSTGTTLTTVSTAPSFPNSDAFFSGQFIGDYNGMTSIGTTARPIWTDVRGANPSYPGNEMDGMVFAG